MHIELRDDRMYSAIGIGTITFKREFISPLCLKSCHVFSRPKEEPNLCSSFGRL